MASGKAPCTRPMLSITPCLLCGTLVNPDPVVLVIAHMLRKARFPLMTLRAWR